MLDMMKKLGLLLAILYFISNSASCIFTYCYETSKQLNFELIHNKTHCENEISADSPSSQDCQDSQIKLGQALVSHSLPQCLPKPFTLYTKQDSFLQSLAGYLTKSQNFINAEQYNFKLNCYSYQEIPYLPNPTTSNTTILII